MTKGEMAEEEDYMTMSILDPVEAKEKETYIQRSIRREREVCYFPSCTPPTL